MSEENRRKLVIEKLVKYYIQIGAAFDWIKILASLRETLGFTEEEKYEIVLHNTLDKEHQLEFKTTAKDSDKTIDGVIKFAINRAILPSPYDLRIMEELGVKLEPETAKQMVEAYKKSNADGRRIDDIVLALKTSEVDEATIDIIINWAMETNYTGAIFEAIQLKKIPKLTKEQAETILAECVEQRDLANAINAAESLDRKLTIEEIEKLTLKL